MSHAAMRRALAAACVVAALVLGGRVHVGAPRLPVTHVSFHNAACVCPVCWIGDSFHELSVGEYC